MSVLFHSALEHIRRALGIHMRGMHKHHTHKPVDVHPHAHECVHALHALIPLIDIDESVKHCNEEFRGPVIVRLQALASGKPQCDLNLSVSHFISSIMSWM